MKIRWKTTIWQLITFSPKIVSLKSGEEYELFFKIFSFFVMSLFFWKSSFRRPVGCMTGSVAEPENFGETKTRTGKKLRFRVDSHLVT